MKKIINLIRIMTIESLFMIGLLLTGITIVLVFFS